MKIWIVRILAVILFLGALAAAGMAGYRVGYLHAAQASVNSDDVPRVGRFHHGGFDMPKFGDQTGRGFQHDFHSGNPMLSHRGGFGFSPFGVLFKVAFLGLVIWGVYLLFKGNGWQLTLARVQPLAEQTSPKPEAVVAKKTRRGKQ